MSNPAGIQPCHLKPFFFTSIILFFYVSTSVANLEDPAESLIEAARKADLDKIIRLVKQGVDVNGMDGGGRVPLESASSAGQFEAVQLLLEMGADVNRGDKKKNTALQVAARRGHLNIVKLLLSYRADINLKNDFGDTPLLEASGMGHYDIVKLLLDFGADISLVDRSGQSAFLKAAERGHVDTAKLLYGYYTTKPSIDDINNAFVTACGRGRHEDGLRYFLDLGADINYSSDLGWTGVIYASVNGRHKTVKFLLENGADINRFDKFGNTALINAAKEGKIEVVEVLLEYKPDMEIRNRKGATALMLAKNDTIRGLLKKHGAKEVELLDLAMFQLKHALPYDKRLVEGLRLALIQYFHLFSSQPGALRTIKVSTSQIDLTRYKITYHLNIDGKQKAFDLTLSNQGSAILDNIEKVKLMFQNVSKEVIGNKKISTKRSEEHESFNSEISELVSHYDPFELLKAIQYIDHHLSTGAADPELLYQASEIFSWLAFFKNRNLNRNLSDLLASRAVCNYLMACLGDVDVSNKSFYEGLLLLSLDYPAAAIDVFNRNRPIEKMLSAFITFDFETLISFSSHPIINKRLLYYLTARAYESSNQDTTASQHYEKLMHDYPDFLLAKEYVIDNGRLGMARRYIMEYIEELLEKHLYIFKDFMETQWLDRNTKFELEIRKEPTERNRLVKWLKIHSALVNRKNEMKKNSGLLDAEFLSRFMMEDMSNALLIHFNIEDYRLGRGAQATEIAEMVKEAYPESTISRVLMLKSHKNSPSIQPIIESIPIDKADRILLRTLMDVYKPRSDYNYLYIQKYIKKENPDAIGLYRLYEYYQKLFFCPFAINSLKNALITDPYQYVLYEKILSHGEGEEYIKSGERHIGHLYGFLTSVAAWYHKNGNNKAAISYYNQAIKASPSQKIAYYELGEIHRKEKKYDDAIKMWGEYLQYDQHSLSAVSIRNAMGNAWLEKGEYKKAYDIFMESKNSAQAGALLGFAEVSEKTGKTLQSEKYFKKAAERYPVGSCPAKLGVFYLRQNNPDMAYQVFREYKRFNQFYYYFNDLIDYFIEIKNPKKVVQLVRNIEKGTDYAIMSHYIMVLADIFASKKEYDIASSLMRPLAQNGRKPIYVSNYWDFNIKGKISPPEKVLSDIVRWHSGSDYILNDFGPHLIETGYYDEALKALDHLFTDKRSQRKEDLQAAIVNMALAWRLGSRDPNIKKKIKSRIKDLGGDGWWTYRVGFLLGEIDEKEILKLADTQEKRTYIYYYIGMINKENGKKDEAIDHLLMCLETMEPRHKEFHNAYRIARKMANEETN